MADVRMTVRGALLVALACAAGTGCGEADAQPSIASGLTPPAGWQPLPPLAEAARAALGTTPIDGVEAWGEPAMGCYAVWMATRGPGGAVAVADRILAGLTGAPPDGRDAGAPSARVDVQQVVKPTAAQGVLAFAFERAPYRGRFRARLGDGRIIALACFANQREPRACEAACTTFLGSLP